VIEDGVIIGDRTVIGAGSYIGHASRLGADCLLYAASACGSGRSWAIAWFCHCGVVLGADGLALRPPGAPTGRFPQVGHVEIGDDVEIGANTTIDRGRFGRTRWGSEVTKIDKPRSDGHRTRHW